MSTRSNKPPVIKNKKTTSSRPKPVYEVEDKKKEFSCLRCDRKFKVQTNNFFYTNSAIYRANNYYVPICKTCVEELFTHYKNILGDEYEAMRRVCIKLDWYYSPDCTALHCKTLERHKSLTKVSCTTSSVTIF